jgi:hypothetical protein
MRYYARTTRHPEKRLTRDEAEAIVASGLGIGIVSQGAGDTPSSFDRSTGIEDAAHARCYGAAVIGQPAGSAIYFAVDYDADEADVAARILPYFEGIRDRFGPAGDLPDYRVGVYGNGLVCGSILDSGLAQLAWLSQRADHHGHEAFRKSRRWTLLQHPSTRLCDIGVDVDDVRPGVVDFGGFARLDDLRDRPAPGAGEASGR